MNEMKNKRRRESWERNLCLIQGKLLQDTTSNSFKLSVEKKIFIWVFNSQNDRYRMHSKRPLILLFLSFRNIFKPTETKALQLKNLIVIVTRFL